MFEFLLGRDDPTRGWPAASGQPLTFDLDASRLNAAGLGDALESAAFLGPAEDPKAAKHGACCYYSRGVSVSCEKGTTILWFELWFEDDEGPFQPFAGAVAHRGERVSLAGITVDEFQSRFGECYWRDVDEDETILFYEFADHEWQVEFNERNVLKGWLITSQPLMANAAQRQAYGVTKPWPPPAWSV